MIHFVLVFGGVISGVGKGITTAALARAFTALGLPVAILKVDPYLNVDAGTMSPHQHGEVYVLADGREADLDIGHYERFLGRDLPGSASITAGRVIRGVFAAERRGDYLGQTVQYFPHVSSAVIDAIRTGAADQLGGVPGGVCFVEIGGTPGDVEAAVFLEAGRQLALQAPTVAVQVAYLPRPSTLGEHKTKPAQGAIKRLRAAGIAPDLVVCRAAVAPDATTIAKVNAAAAPGRAVALPDLASVYAAPVALTDAGAVGVLIDALVARGMPRPGAPVPDWGEWARFNAPVESPVGMQPRVAIVAKYAGGADTYLSLQTGLQDAGFVVSYIDAEDFVGGTHEERVGAAKTALGAFMDAADTPAAIVVAGGFGNRGVEGKVAACAAARDVGLPTLAICLGMQTMAVAAAREGGFLAAGLAECGAAPDDAVVGPMPAHSGGDIGGTLRCGEFELVMAAATAPYRRDREASGRVTVSERFRHRHALARGWEDRLEAAGVLVRGYSALDAERRVPVVLEWTGGAWFVGVQFHPEYRSTPLHPHPLFTELHHQTCA